MQNILNELNQDPINKRLIIMPLTRLVFEDFFRIGKFNFFPQGTIEINSLRPISNKTIFTECDEDLGCSVFEGQTKREVISSLTGFDIEVLNTHPLVAFIEEIDWNKFLGYEHQEDVDLLKKLSSKAEKALDIIRFDYCRFDLSDTLPGIVGSWKDSQAFLGALLYTSQDHKSYLIAGEAIECSSVVKGLGLQVDHGRFTPLPTPSNGEIGAIAQHGLLLFSDVMNSSNETVKFIRIMSLLEFLSNPDEYQSWKNLKANIVCHCAKDLTSYHRISARFKELTSKMDDNKQVGLRTLVVHHGKLIPDLIPEIRDRKELFRELQGYCSKVLSNMIDKKNMSWQGFCTYREGLKKSLKI